MKRLSVFLCAMAFVFGVVGTANSALTTIGTATYMGSDYNLIYEDDSIDGGLVWLDYSNSPDIWQDQKNWAEGLSFSDIDIHLTGYTTDIDWGTGWRLPLTQDESWGYNQTGSEMGHLYFESLGNVAFFEPGWGLTNVFDFNNLQSDVYWSGTEFSPGPKDAWLFWFNYGGQDFGEIGLDGYALAVHPATVSAVPIPSAIWLLGSGLIGLVGFRRKIRREKL